MHLQRSPTGRLHMRIERFLPKMQKGSPKEHWHCTYLSFRKMMQVHLRIIGASFRPSVADVGAVMEAVLLTSITFKNAYIPYGKVYCFLKFSTLYPTWLQGSEKRKFKAGLTQQNCSTLMHRIGERHESA